MDISHYKTIGHDRILTGLHAFRLRNRNRPFSLSSIVNDKIFGSIHSLTVVSRSPAAAINANLAVLTIGERSSLVGSGDSTT